MRSSLATTNRLLIGAAVLALATPSLAQNQQQAANQDEAPAQDVIIVTATKRASTVQDVPFSINAQTQEDIQRANASTIEDISRNIAGLAVQNLGPGQSQVSVRGVSAGQIVRDQPGVKEQVGVYLDESVISLSLFTPDFDLFDLNRVETLRGPQGTLFGSGSVGGTIRYITNQPSTKRTEGLVEANINTVADGGIGGHLKGMANLPISDKAALRIVGYRTNYAGFIDAVGPAAGEDVNEGSRTGVRASLSVEMMPGLTVTPRLVYQEVEAGGFNRQDAYIIYANANVAGSTVPGEREQYLLLREKFRDRTLLGDLVVSADLGGAELSSVTSYINRDILVSRDASALTGSVGLVPLAGAGVNPAIAKLPSNLRDTTDLTQWAQELRLASTGDSPFQWVVGGFLSRVDRTYAQRLPTPGYDVFIDAALGAGVSAGAANGFPLNSPYNADIPYDIRQNAIFGEGSYDFGQFKLTAGARYYDFKEERDFVSGGVFSNGDTFRGDRTKSSGVSPRVILTYEPDRNLSINAQVAKGFRLGGVNDPLNIPLCTGGASGVDAQTFGNRPTYDDETLWNYEAGVKYQRRGVTFNAAAFYNDIKDLQVTADAGSCSSRVVFNVPKAHARGVELELGIQPSDALDLSLSGSIVNAEFDSSVTTTSGAVIAGIRDGNRLPTVPKFQMAASGTYSVPVSDHADGYITASFQHVGNRITQPSDQEAGASVFNFIYYNMATNGFGTSPADFGSLKLPSYNVVNLSAGVEFTSGLDVIVYANNLFDENPLLSLDRERGGRARLGYNIGQPRQIGLTVRQAFGKR